MVCVFPARWNYGFQPRKDPNRACKRFPSQAHILFYRFRRQIGWLFPESFRPQPSPPAGSWTGDTEERARENNRLEIHGCALTHLPTGFHALSGIWPIHSRSRNCRLPQSVWHVSRCSSFLWSFSSQLVSTQGKAGTPPQSHTLRSKAIRALCNAWLHLTFQYTLLAPCAFAVQSGGDHSNLIIKEEFHCRQGLGAP